MGKRWIRRAWGGPSEGWSSKTASDDFGCGVPSPEKDPRAHTCTHALMHGQQAAREGRRVTARAVLVAGGVATGV